MIKTLCLFIVCGIVVTMWFGCKEAYREVEFPSATVFTTPQKNTWYIESKEGIPIPIYIFYKGNYFKLDTQVTADETKKFLRENGWEYKEIISDINGFSSSRRHVTHRLHYINSGMFTFYYHDGKLVRYKIMKDVKAIAGVKIGISKNALFSIKKFDVILSFDEVKKMFGNDYKIQKRYYK